MAIFAPELLAWMRAHHDVATSAVLLDHGITVDQRRRLVAQRVLVRIINGAYTFPGRETQPLTRCAALCLCHDDVVVGGPTAAALWELPGYSLGDEVSALAPPGRRPCAADWLNLFHTEPPHRDEVVMRADGINLTSPPRTTVDLARFVPPGRLEPLIERLLHRHCGEAVLRQVAERYRSRGRPWVGGLLEFIDARGGVAPTESTGELKVFHALRRRGVEGLVRQHRIELPGYGPARFDLAVPAIRLDIEVDLHPSHRTPEGIARDDARDAAAAAIGWTTRRLGPLVLGRARIAETMDAVAAEIANLRRRRPGDAVVAS